MTKDREAELASPQHRAHQDETNRRHRAALDSVSTPASEPSEADLAQRIFAALGVMRDIMPEQDVKAVQRFARCIAEVNAGNAALKAQEQE